MYRLELPVFTNYLFFASFYVYPPVFRKRFETCDFVNINDFKTAAERYDFANKIITDLRDNLKNGWSMFLDTETAVYEGQTQYAAEAAVFKKMVDSNKNYIYWCSKYINEILYPSGLNKDSIITYLGRYRVFKNWLIREELITLDIVAITNAVIYDFFFYLRDEKKNSAHTSASYAGLLNNLFDFIIKIKVWLLILYLFLLSLCNT